MELQETVSIEIDPRFKIPRMGPYICFFLNNVNLLDLLHEYEMYIHIHEQGETTKPYLIGKMKIARHHFAYTKYVQNKTSGHFIKIS